MQAILIQVLLAALQQIATGVLAEAIKRLVTAAITTDYQDIPATDTTPFISANQQRKAAVMNELRAMEGQVGDAARNMSGWLLSMLVDAAVAKQTKNLNKAVTTLQSK